MEEAHRADHLASIAAAQRAVHVYPEVSSLKKVVPAAAAIAVATAAAAQATMPKKSEGPAIHRDVTEQTEHRQPPRVI
jgi:stearoyl-CoA desaturase (delta-9 desaturase)